MSSNKYKKPLSLKLKPSKTLFYFIVSIHSLAIYVLTLSLKIHIIFLIIIFIFVCLNMYINLKQNGFLGNKCWIDKIQFVKDMEWHLQRVNKNSFNSVLQKNWFSLPLMLILYFKIPDGKGKTRALIILPDMIDKKDFRQLKLYLSELKS